jgi:predicted flap endonuclease-1-like 5' DNA nuclease
VEVVTMDFVSQNLALIAIAVVIAIVVALLLLRPRQRVRLSNDNTPQRPHMAYTPERGKEGKGLAAQAAGAATDVAGEILHVPVHEHLPGAAGPPDDLVLLKGVGPKFAELLNERGIVKFAQIAHLTADEIHRLDPTLGPFRGRLVRDRIVEQAHYLARGDIDGFEQRFGKL